MYYNINLHFEEYNVSRTRVLSRGIRHESKISKKFAFYVCNKAKEFLRRIVARGTGREGSL